MNVSLRFVVAVSAVFVSLSTVGCTTLKKEQPVVMDEQEKPSSPTGEKILTAFQKNDAKGFIAILPEDGQRKFTETDFNVTRESMIKNLGEPVEFVFVGNLKHPIANVCVWRVRFERQNMDKTETIQQETLFRVVTAKNGNGELISFNFL